MGFDMTELTAVEMDLLAGAGEECGEVMQVIGKILRHGLESYKPTDPMKITNRQKLTEELADISCLIDMLAENGVIDQTWWVHYKANKRERFLNYSKVPREDFA